MNRRWEVSEEILGTLVLDSSTANSVTINSSNTQITYNWFIPDWSFVFNHNSNPGDKWHCTHEFYADYCSAPGLVDQAANANLTTLCSQTYMVYSTLCGAAYDTTSQNSSFINAVNSNTNVSFYWNTVTSTQRNTIITNRVGYPRSFVIDNPHTQRNIRIMFQAGSGSLWTSTAGVQGTDYFTAGKHIFTFRKLKFL